jgi:hypothetical protein
MTDNQAAGTGASSAIPVSRERIRDCLDSARFWTATLPHYADREQKWADVFGLVAGLVSALTGLAIWPVLATGNATSSQLTPGAIVISVAAMVAAVAALVPRVMNFAEMAGQARELASRYGAVLGQLEDLVHVKEIDQDAARAIVDEFQATKQKKDALRRLPGRDEVEIRNADARRRRAEAEARAAAAESKLKAGTRHAGEREDKAAHGPEA